MIWDMLLLKMNRNFWVLRANHQDKLQIGLHHNARSLIQACSCNRMFFIFFIFFILPRYCSPHQQVKLKSCCHTHLDA